jgi:hypothetical protein
MADSENDALSSPHRLMSIFLTFVFLQACDALTTLLLLAHGGAEANPLVRAAMRIAHQPAAALILLKVAACALAWFALRSGRTRLLPAINWFFAVCVVWNLAAIALV